MEEQSKIRPILQYMRVILKKENNMFHLFALSENFLKAISKEIKTHLMDPN